MLKSLIIALSLLVGSASFAQGLDKPFEHLLDWKGNLTVRSISDSAKNSSCVLVKNAFKLKALLFDQNLLFKKDFEINIANEKIVDGYIISNQTIMIDLEPEFGTNRIHHIEIDIQSGKLRDTSFTLPFKGEEVIGRINTGNSFQHITLSKKKPIFNVYTQVGANLKKVSYDLAANGITKRFPQGDLWNALSPNSGISRPATIGLINSELETDVAISSLHNKLYLVDSVLTLIIDQHASSVGILTLDLSNKHSTYRTLSRPFDEFAKQQFNNPDYNSFLIKDRLYSIYVTTDSLSLIIQDFKSGKLLQHYRTLANENISFRNTPIMQQEGGSTYSDIEKTKLLIRKILNSNVVISGSRTADGLDLLTIGAYKHKESTGAFIPMGGAIAGALTASLYLLANQGFGYSSWDEVVRFQSQIHPETTKHVAGEIKESKYDLIQKYLLGLKTNLQASILLTNKFHQLAYFHKKEKKLVVMKF